MDKQARKFQITINNPKDNHESLRKILSGITALEYFCMADEIGLETETPHTHIYIALKNSTRFSTIKRKFPEAHIESAKGSHAENRAYITKSGKWANDPKRDTSIPGTFEEWGELPEEENHQGERSDLQLIATLIESGLTPSQIMRQNFAWRRYERMIRSAYFDKRKQETPTVRDVKVHYLVGESGSGKSYTYSVLCKEWGEESVYFLTDYDGGGFDHYEAERLLFIDEYKGQFPFAFLLVLLDVYKAQVHARYANIVSLWNEVYITSVFPPEELYKRMVEEDLRGRDKQQQLLRRITDITYCFQDSAKQFQRYTIPMSEYTDYAELKMQALEHIGAPTPATTDFQKLDKASPEELPF